MALLSVPRVRVTAWLVPSSCCSPLLRPLPGAGTDPQDRVLVVRKCFRGRKIRVSPEGLLLGLSEALVHSVDRIIGIEG